MSKLPEWLHVEVDGHTVRAEIDLGYIAEQELDDPMQRAILLGMVTGWITKKLEEG